MSAEAAEGAPGGVNGLWGDGGTGATPAGAGGFRGPGGTGAPEGGVTATGAACGVEDTPEAGTGLGGSFSEGSLTGPAEGVAGGVGVSLMGSFGS